MSGVLTRLALFIAAVVFTAVLGAYFHLERWFSMVMGQQGRLSVRSQCEDAGVFENGARTNPNKMLFISCGGFLE